jgi:transposase
MRKTFLVRLTAGQVAELKEVIVKQTGSHEMVRRANILLAANVDGMNWTDQRIAEAYHCTRQTVEKVRKRFVENGFEATLRARRRAGRPKKLSGRQEAEVIALRLTDPPKGYSSWTLRLVAEKAVELEIVDSLSHEQVRKTLKKRLNTPKD